MSIFKPQSLIDLFNCEYDKNHIKNLIGEGVVVNLGGKQIKTGFYKSSPVENLVRNNSNVRWSHLGNYIYQAKNPKLRQLIRMLVVADSRKKEYPLIFNFADKMRVTHFNIPSRLKYGDGNIKLYSSPLFSYGISGTYVSSGNISRNKLKLSECSIDIIKDRFSKGLLYSNGCILDLPKNDNFFYIERKENQEYQNYFIRNVVKEYGIDTKNLLPSALELKNLNSDTHKLMDCLEDEKVSIDDKFRSINTFTEKNSFSIVGYALFDSVHEYFTSLGLNINEANRILSTLDKSQATHWSMRGFKIHDNVALNSIFENSFSFELFQLFVVSEVHDKLKIFTGNEREKINECSFNSLFNIKSNLIEKMNISNEVDNHKYNIPSFLRDKVWINNNGVLSFKENLSHNDKIKFINSQDNSRLKLSLRTALNHADVGFIVPKIKEKMTNYSKKVIDENKLGVLATPYQPDNRGEYLLSGLSAKTKSSSMFVELEKSEIANESYIISRTQNLNTISN